MTHPLYIHIYEWIINDKQIMNIKQFFLGALVLAIVATGSASAATYTWTSTLKQGSTGEQVKNLQKFLNMYPAYQVSTSGAGSPGYETTSFASKTKAAVQKFQAANGLTADGVFGPMSRAKAVAVQDGNPSTPNTTVQTGPIMASLATSNPASGYIVNSQAAAPLLAVNFTGSGIVNSVTLTRSGFSGQSTLSNVYLYDGNTRLTDGYSFNSASTLTMNGLNLMVSGSRTITVRADASSTAATNDSTIAVALSSFTAGTSVNTVNIKGNDMFLAASSNTASASLSANTASGSTANAGITGHTFWSAPLQINTRTVNLMSAAFRMIGSAPVDAVTNLRLFIDGIDSGVTGMITSINGTNYAMFSGMSKALTTGSHTVELRGNIDKGSSRTVQFSLQQAADLMLMDTQSGVNIAVSGTLPNNGVNVTINSGSLTISVDPSFNSLTTVTGGASNITIAKYKLRAYGEDVKVSSIELDPTFTVAPTVAGGCTNDTNCSLDDITLYFNGTQVGSQQDWTGLAATNLTYTLGSQMIVPAGADSWLEVKANLRTTGGLNYTAGSLRANLVVGSSNAQGQSSYTNISTPAVTSNALAIQAGLLNVGVNAGYSSQNLNPNTAGVKIGSFNLQNTSSSESVRVTSLLVNVAYGAGAGSTNLSSLRTSEASGSGATPQQPTTAAASGNANNTFSVDFTIAPGAVKTIDIFADSGSAAGATVTVQTSLTVTSLGATSNVSISQNGNGTAVAGQTVAMRTGTVATPTIVPANSTVAQLIPAAVSGSADGSKAVYNISSTDASATVTELTFTVTSGTATSVRVGSVSAPVVGTTAYLTGLNIVVPNGGSGVNVDVFVSYPPVGTGGVTSNTASTLTLTTVKYTSGNATTTLGSLTVAAPQMTLVGSIPAYTVSDSSETLANGTVKIAEVTVAANSKGDIRIGQLPVLVTSTGAVTVASAADNIVVRDTSGQLIATKNATFAVAAGGSATGIICFDTATAACASGQAVANGYLIPAGTSKTFRIYVTAATVAADNSLSTKLGAASSASFYDVAGGNSTAIVGTLLNNYPADTSVISN